MIDNFPPLFPEEEKDDRPSGQIIINDQGGPCRIDLEKDGSFAVHSPYSDKFRTELYRLVPENQRKWDKPRKVWIIGPKFISNVIEAIYVAYGQTIKINNITLAEHLLPTTETRSFDLYYLGLPRWRQFGEEPEGYMSLGHLKRQELRGELVFPLETLTEYFGEKPDYSKFQQSSANVPVVQVNYYQILGVPKAQWLIIDTAELKKLYRKGAKLYHPDVSGEANATEKFQDINNAWEILGDEAKRARYDFALKVALIALNAAPSPTLKDKINRDYDETMWLPPVRCGKILVEGYSFIGRFIVKHIVDWADLAFPQGIAVTYWNAHRQQVDIDYI